MKKAVAALLGVLMLAVGVLWTAQGLGYVGGSVMTGQSIWAILGPIVAGLGLALLIVTFQHRRH